MTDNLHRLVYYSRHALDSGAALTVAVDDILATSRRNNAAVAVTGALMFNAGCFGQVLEGPSGAIQATFARIGRDPRHHGVTVLSFEPVGERSFGHWSMGFVGARPDDAAAFAHVGVSSGFDPSAANGDALFHALRRLALRDEGA